VKNFFNILLFSLLSTFLFVTLTAAQEVEKSECWDRPSGQKSCSGTTEDPLILQVKNNSGVTPQAGSSTSLVTAPGSGNSNNGCAFCAPPNVNDPQDTWDNFVPGSSPSDSGTAVEVER